MRAATGRPAYVEVANDLRAKIADGTYPPGSTLPSTSQLMRHYEVSVTVARAAIGELRVEGLTLGQPGKGVYVTRVPADAPAGDPIALARRVDQLAEQVRRVEERLAELEQGRTPPPEG